MEQDVGLKPTSLAWKARAQSIYQPCDCLVFRGNELPIFNVGFEPYASSNQFFCDPYVVGSYVDVAYQFLQ